MPIEEIKAALVGRWVSLATEVRPSKNPDGTLKPFFLTRNFVYHPEDRFELTVVNYADDFGKVPVMSLDLAGTMTWRGEHPIAPGAQKVDFAADGTYAVTPLVQGFADLLNRVVAGGGYGRWEVGAKQDILRKPFPPFALTEGQVFKEYDLVYVARELLFWGARHIDGRGFDTEANRPTNLQIPLVRS